MSRPGLRVRARNGYSTPRTRTTRPPALTGRETPPILAELLDSPLPRPGLPMQMQATAFEGQAGKDKVVLAIEVGGEGFRFTEKDGMFHDTLELSLLSVDAAGKTSNKARENSENVTTRQLKEEAWFAKLPLELRKSIRAGVGQKPPRAYEERLKKYFQSVD